MTKAKQTYHGEELTFEDLTAPEALKIYKRLNNKYTAKVKTIGRVGNSNIVVGLNRQQVVELLTYEHDTRQYKNCLESTRWSIKIGRASCRERV